MASRKKSDLIPMSPAQLERACTIVRQMQFSPPIQDYLTKGGPAPAMMGLTDKDLDRYRAEAFVQGYTNALKHAAEIVTKIPIPTVDQVAAN